jgi:hypothetical protein
MMKKVIDGLGRPDRQWETVQVDFSAFAGREITLRLYQRVLVPNRVAGNACWKNLRLE